MWNGNHWKAKGKIYSNQVGTNRTPYRDLERIFIGIGTAPCDLHGTPLECIDKCHSLLLTCRTAGAGSCDLERISIARVQRLRENGRGNRAPTSPVG